MHKGPFEALMQHRCESAERQSPVGARALGVVPTREIWLVQGRLWEEGGWEELAGGG